MWSEMSYNQYKLTFLERLENEPDFDENVFSYYTSARIIANHFVEKKTKREGFDWD